MLRELHDKSIKTLNSKYFNLGNSENKSNDVQFEMVELFRKYNSLSNVDRLHMVKTEVDDIKIVMRTNVNKMVDNIDQVEVNIVFM
jgi:hypothetical protein